MRMGERELLSGTTRFLMVRSPITGRKARDESAAAGQWKFIGIRLRELTKIGSWAVRALAWCCCMIIVSAVTGELSRRSPSAIGDTSIRFPLGAALTG